MTRMHLTIANKFVTKGSQYCQCASSPNNPAAVSRPSPVSVTRVGHPSRRSCRPPRFSTSLCCTASTGKRRPQ
eukprot:12908958-Prorocentrum_lima.AAC.1